MATKLNDVLQQLADEGRAVPGAGLKTLSNLSREDTASLAAAWPALSETRRRETVARLADLAEDNIELNFDTIFAFCLADRDPVVRRRAVQALWETEDRRLIAPLVDRLTEDDDELVRVAAAQALGRYVLLGAEDRLQPADQQRVEQALLDVIAERSTSIDVRRRAIESLSVSPHSKVPGIIEEAYHSSDLVMRTSAVHAMGRTCDPRWLPVVLEELKSEHPEMRYEAAAACGEMEAEEAVPDLLPLIEDEDTEVQTSAILALGQIGGPVARQVLQRLLQHGNPTIQSAAEEALDLIAFEDSPLGLNFD